MQFSAFEFSELSKSQLYQLLKLRQDVFVIEQKCLYPDIDEQDDMSLHVLGLEGDRLISYCRIMPPGTKFVEASIGRVCVAKKNRKQHLGHDLIAYAIETALDRYETHTIRISAQAHLSAFYQRHGFVVSSKPYDEDDIPHVEMLFETKPVSA